MYESSPRGRHGADAQAVAIAPRDLIAKDRLAALGSAAQPSRELAGVLQQMRRDRVLAFAFHAPAGSQLAGFIGQLGIEPEAGHGWIDLGPTLRAEVVARFATAEKAAAAAKQTFGGPLAKLRNTSRDREVVYSIELDATETTQLVDQLVEAAR